MEQFSDFSKVTGCIVSIKSANNEAAGRGHRYNFVKSNPAKEKSFVPGLDEKIRMIGVIAPKRSSFDNRHKNYIGWMVRIALFGANKIPGVRPLALQLYQSGHR